MLPTGLSKNGSIISGTPTEAGEWSVIMRASNRQESSGPEPRIVKSEIWIASDSPDSLSEFVDLLPQNIATAERRSEKSVVLHSERFAAIETGLYQYAEALVENVVALMHVYAPGKARKVSVHQTSHWFEDGTSASDKRLNFRVTNSGSTERLSKGNPSTGETLGAQILLRAEQDDDVRYALRLLRVPDPAWPDIYDVIEFLSPRLGVGHDKEVGRHRGTANHYRHLGNVGKNKLPPKPTTLLESQEFVFGMLRSWLEARLREPLPREGSGQTG
jgi:hypothetical protein